MASNALSTIAILSGALIFGLKHALDADHLAAVSTIATQRKGLWSASMVGVLWGIGHTLTLLLAGVAVILLHFEIRPQLALALEFAVALMLIALGTNALRRLAGGGRMHVHAHEHGAHTHIHPHLHGGAPEVDAHSHHASPLSSRPLLVGMVHGLAGSAALMLMVLSTIPSPLLGFAYVAVFGVGSIGGMLVMSLLVSLPAQLTVARFTRAHLAVRTLAGLFSLGLGLFMAYQIGVVDGLLV